MSESPQRMPVNATNGAPEGKWPLRDSVAQFLVERSPMGIVLCDGDGLVIAWNGAAAHMFAGGAAPCPEGTPMLKLFCDLTESAGHDIAQSLARGGPWRSRYKGASALGAHLNCDLTLERFETEDGGEGWCVYAIDITEQAALHQSLMQSEKLSSLGEIVAGVAHELNNPLTGILGYAQLVLGAVTDSKVRSRLEQIALEATRCRQIVQSLLGFSRHYQSQKSPHDLNSLVSDMLLLREYQMRVDDIAITVVQDNELPLIEIDRHEMQRVLLNILNNAHEALVRKKSGERLLTVRTAREGNELRIVIEDNGLGISDEHRGKLFDPFFSTKDVGEGTGLGLSVAYGVVREHGGEIRVVSSPGNGAAFIIALPLSE